MSQKPRGSRQIWATFKGQKEPCYFPPLDADPDQFTLGKLRPKRNDKGFIMGSPLIDRPVMRNWSVG
ncbi:hypothetical protein [Bradyrhizobium sp. CCGUVB23]|uniref:hypothetical protein n=1 Tax=Bradyrhizobium sp. CCGUVB23 TaxID=2949630 RepID=UPI0020B28A6D|nr:hypothetical protein [Bradyrhizobium sp. CCGUVB23]MCP3460587.1 hypothetical protein [Bradyrhizobium sp. CCGUVB23]